MIPRISRFSSVLLCTALLGATVALAEKQWSAPDGEAADMAKPVKVVVLLGQSNMLGFGPIAGAEKANTLEYAVEKEGLYPYLRQDGAWTTRKDVRNVFVMHARGKMGVKKNDWLTPSGRNIGPEMGIGWHLGEYFGEPVMVLKACIGNRGLGWDLLPPGSERYEVEEKNRKTGEMKTMVYAGYKDSPSKWEKGTKPTPIGWYAGKQYDDDVGNAKKVLADLQTYYPEAKGHEVIGFFWWQGCKDKGNPAYFERYEHNLGNLIRALRKDFDAPKAKFVGASLGETKAGATDGGGKIHDALQAIANPEKHPEFAGDAAAVYTHPMSKGGSSCGHYSKHAQTYMNIGLGMGEAMVELLRAE